MESYVKDNDNYYNHTLYEDDLDADTDSVETTTPVYTKEDLIQTVRQWVQIDNQIRQMNKMLKKLKEDKKSHNTQMIEIMKSYSIDNFELKDGQIQYKKYKSRETLTQKKLLEILSKHPQLQQEQVQLLNEFVFDNRKIIEKDVVIRKVINGST